MRAAVLLLQTLQGLLLCSMFLCFSTVSSLVPFLLSCRTWSGFTQMTGNVLGSEVKAAAWLWKGSECQEEREDRDKVSQSQSPKESAPSCISKEACGF